MRHGELRNRKRTSSRCATIGRLQSRRLWRELPRVPSCKMTLSTDPTAMVGTWQRHSARRCRTSYDPEPRPGSLSGTRRRVTREFTVASHEGGSDPLTSIGKLLLLLIRCLRAFYCGGGLNE